MGTKGRKSSEPDPDATNLSLLGKTQEYLKSLFQHRAPDSLLVAAWDEFYRIYNEIIRRFVIACRVPPSQVDDCVQEVWMAVAKHLTEFKHPIVRPGLRAWLYRLVRSKAADVIRANKRLPRSLDIVPQEAVADPKAFTLWERVFVDIVLDEVAGSQPPLRCQVFRLKFLEGRRAREIASQLGVATHVVHYHYRKMVGIVQRRISLYAGSAVILERPPQEGADGSA